jgi:hypothetical protein
VKYLPAVALMVLVTACCAPAQTASKPARSASASPVTLEQMKSDARNLDRLVAQLQRSLDPSGMTLSVNTVQKAWEIEQLAAGIKRETKNHPAGK